MHIVVILRTVVMVAVRLPWLFGRQPTRETSSGMICALGRDEGGGEALWPGFLELDDTAPGASSSQPVASSTAETTSSKTTRVGWKIRVAVN